MAFGSRFFRAFLGIVGTIALCHRGELSAEEADAKLAIKLTAPELAREIDAQIDEALAAKRLPPSPRASDAEFLRRVYLDIVGTIPPLERVEPFLADSRPEKRAEVIDQLLMSPEYVRHMTDQWREHLIPSTAAAARRRHETGLLWLEEAFRANRPYDEFIRGILTADGMQRDNGATTFLLTHQSLDEVTDRLSRVLLGVQITCAQCHDHPFADWKQGDYWGIAAFFSKVKPQYERINNVEHYGVSERGDRKPLMLPPSFQEFAPTYLGGREANLDKSEPYLPRFVDWLASDENPYFARAFVNRLWRKFMGRGLVEPVDDLREANPGTHPRLLALLGEQFRRSGFDIHYLIRAITLSDAYQRTSRPVDGNEGDTEWYSHMPVKVMSPYALGDSVQTFMRLGDNPPAAPPAEAPMLSPDEQLKASQRARGTRDSFAVFFKGEDNPSPTAYETGVPQALRLMNSQELNRGSRVITKLSQTHKERAAIIEQLYLATLTRHPTDAELQIALKHIESQPDATRALGDVAWALLNSTEFFTNH
ncbi:MAG: DUF1549 and DUF1553 domain-containing protein [Pirellulaceae bacterium]|nr:DUF1549 and DUF1553 domain-containing protein [Pirellulaceae bacterium]